MTELAQPETIPDGLALGAADRGNGQVTFALFAPGKQSVHLIGDFNDWKASADPLQQYNGGVWWCAKALTAGPHEYQFIIDQETVICDPYARALHWIKGSRTPRAVIEAGKEAYRWAHDDWVRPDLRDLIIYEIMVRDFTPEGNLRGVMGRLDYLKDLGVNAIELMPVMEFHNDNRWGYDPLYFFSVENRYGSADDLRALVDEAHQHGIAVILDLVVAHTDPDHPFMQLYPWDQSPWYGRGFGERNQFGFPTLDYSKPETERFMNDVQQYWIREFHVDGLRYDYLQGVGVADGKGVPSLVRSARAARDDVYLIGEYSPEKPEEACGSGLDAAWHVYIGYVLKSLLRRKPFIGYKFKAVGPLGIAEAVKAVNPRECGYARAPNAVNYIESHDEFRLTFSICQVFGRSVKAVLGKSALGASVLLTIPGEPMLFHGQEWGEASRRTLKLNPIHWESLSKPENRKLHEHYRKLCWLRRNHPSLRSDNLAIETADVRRELLVYRRWDETGDQVLVAANFSPDPHDAELEFASNGTWRDIIGDTIIRAEGRFRMKISPITAMIFVREED